MIMHGFISYWLNSALHNVLISDLQLDVKGCRDVYASFDKYVEVERLEGDNKYHAEHYGLQVGCKIVVWDMKNLYLSSSINSF